MNKSTEDRFASGFRGEKKPQSEDNAPDVAVVIAPPGDTEGGPNATPPEVAGGEEGMHGDMPMGGAPMGGESDADLSPEDLQRKKSWEGRLNKREEELKAREAALNAAPEPGATDPNEASEPAAEEATETPAMEAAEQTPGSTADVLANAPDDVKAIAEKFSGDFGEDFVSDMAKLFVYIAEARAGQIASDAIGPLKAQADELRGTIDAVIEGFNSMHAGDLEDNEPEFESIVNSPEFEQWVTSQEPDAQSRIVRALQGGSASRIVRILTQFKDSLKQSAEPTPGSVDTSALDAAAGVRSSGVSVPDTSTGKTGGTDEDAFKRGFYRGK